MVPVKPIISDDDFAAICKTLGFDPVGTGEFRRELTQLYFRHSAVEWSQSGTNWKDNKFPSLREQRDMLTEIAETTKKLADRIEDAYYVVVDDDITHYATPNWFRPIVDQLQATELLAGDTLTGLPDFVKRGPDPDLAFRDLVRILMKMYEEKTGEVATTNSTDDGLNRYASDFQKFFRAVYVGFGLMPIDSLEDKVHKTVIAIRASQT